MVGGGYVSPLGCITQHLFDDHYHLSVLQTCELHQKRTVYIFYCFRILMKGGI